MTSATDQRRAFDSAIARFRSRDHAGALSTFTQLTVDNPSMTDAWLGRLACGDHSVDTLAGAHHNVRALYRETRRLGLDDGGLQANVPAPLYVSIEVWSRGTIAAAYASALIGAQRYDDAFGVLTGADFVADDQAALWRQFVTACLYRATQRWPDLAICDRHLPSIARHVRPQPSPGRNPDAARDGPGVSRASPSVPGGDRSGHRSAKRLHRR